VLLPEVTLPGSEVGEGRIVAFITILGEVVPAAFAAVPSASSTNAIGAYPARLGRGTIGLRFSVNIDYFGFVLPNCNL